MIETKNLKWLHQLYKTHHNCFSCNGNEPNCETFFKKPNLEGCLYNHVAKNDLEKRKQGNPNITLLTMLQEYETK